MFWLKNRLYATRDYFTLNYNSGTIQPNPGDVLYVGASFGAATWTGTLAKLTLTTGTSWTGASAGNAAGTMMVYNTSGTLNVGDTINNNTQAVTGIATAGTSGAGNATPTAAGLYIALGGRSTGNTASWQWCDLGWTIQYKNGGTADFVDMNTALSLVQGNNANYLTTGWKTATAGSQAGWNVIGGTWPGVVASAGDGQMAYHIFNGHVNSGTFTLTGFGFTNSDIPPTASIAGVQIEFTSGGITFSGTQKPLEKTLQLVGVTHGPTPNLASSIAYTTTATGVDTGNNPAAYTYTAKEYGAPSNVVNVPTSNLGYTGLTQPDVVNANFGVSYALTMDGPLTNQHVYFSVDQVRVRITYLPETNGIYFWNGTSAVRAQIVQHYQQGGSLPSSSASGTLYIQFISASGTVGGTPSRTVGSGETIRTYPQNGATPDGGAADGSTLLATSASVADLNVMDWSATLTGAP